MVRKKQFGNEGVFSLYHIWRSGSISIRAGHESWILRKNEIRADGFGEKGSLGGIIGPVF